MPETITSTTNERVKKLLKLREKKERESSGLTIIEGEREILRALEAGVEVMELYRCGKADAATVRRIEEKIKIGKGALIDVAPRVFERIAYGERKEGLLAVARIKNKSLKDLKLKTPALILVLEGVEKPGNLGAVLRTCDAAAVDGVILTEAATDLYNPNTIRSSLGTIFTVNVFQSNNKEAHDFLKKNKVTILATSPEAGVAYAQQDLKKPLAVILGSEDAGLSDFWLKSADIRACIPMKGAVDSLNVSTSAAVVLYEAIRQRSA